MSASTGGIGRHAASLAVRFVAAGHRVCIFCPTETMRAHELADTGARLLPLRGLRLARRADVVHAHGYKAGALAAVPTRLGGPPLVVTWHNAILGRGRSALLGRALQRLTARAADLTLGASSDLVETALDLGARQARLGPVAAPLLPPAVKEPTRLRADLGLEAGELLVLTVSRLAPQKNLGLLLDVARRLRSRQDLRFLVVGDGPLRDSLASRIAADHSRVTLLGRRDDIADLLTAADLALLTSWWEARALVAQEALQFGVPLVSTRVGGIEELVGDAAVLVRPDDAAQAAAAVAELADDPARRAQLAAAGRVRAAGWPDEDDVAADVLAAYAEVLDGSTSGR
nr:glycosyltransferase family 4 protein [Microlunatus panaciterrae]